MRRELMDILCCPVCKAPLKLTVHTEDEHEIVDGELVCTSCAVVYPIEDTIPNLLPQPRSEPGSGPGSDAPPSTNQEQGE